MEKSAIYNSDVDDSAESSSDEEGPQEIPNLPQEAGNPQGGSGNSGKKFIKMVDRIAESKFFQAATENRYIKKAMEGEFRPMSSFLEINLAFFRGIQHGSQAEGGSEGDNGHSGPEYSPSSQR